MRVLAFQGIRYTPRVGDAGVLAAPPYDQINDVARDRFHAQSPHQFVHLTRPVDPEGQDIYKFAADLHARWIEEGILAREERPALYPYVIELAGGGRRLGVLALVEMADAKVIRPHEQTLAKAIADRLALLTAMEVLPREEMAGFAALGELSLANYREVFTRSLFPRFLLNSIFISTVTVALNLLFNSMAAYGLSRLAWPVLMAYFLPALALVLVISVWHRRGGGRVDLQAMDWQTLVGRRAKKDAPDKGGWHMFLTAWQAHDIWNPIANAALDLSRQAPAGTLIVEDAVLSQPSLPFGVRTKSLRPRVILWPSTIV